MIKSTEEPMIFECEGCQLLGMLHRPEIPVSRALIIIVGGPQYRVGSHRQFLLLARSLADSGTAVLRFDYRGMGDSEGLNPGFQNIAPDIRAAVNLLFEEISGLSDVVLWGLCDAASAAALYGYSDDRVSGLVLANPWARTEVTAAKTYLRHYYVSHVFSGGFWKRLITGKVSVLDRISEFKTTVSSYLFRQDSNATSQDNELGAGDRYIEMMRTSLGHFSGKVLFIISGDDLTAAEFTDLVKVSPKWRSLFEQTNVGRVDIDGANHTFSRQVWREKVESLTGEWLKSW